MTAERDWDEEFDVVIAGSGGAGLTAAITARDRGATVAVLERSDKVGGTTAVSGGVVWVPLNHHMPEIGAEDSREEALAYCKRLAAGSVPEAMIETYVDTAHQMVRYLEERTPLRFSVWASPDYYADEVGGKQCGRALEPTLFCKRELGAWADKLRPAPIFMLPLTLQEMLTQFRLMTSAASLPMDMVVQRMNDGMVSCGNALAGALLKACLDRGVSIMLQTRAVQLVREGRRVIGLRAARDGRDIWIRARGGVVLASGGFEWNTELVRKFLPGPLTHPNSPPFNEGDALIMAMEVGAGLSNMTCAWWQPSGAIPGEEYEGRPLSRFLSSERIAPHTIMVNQRGERFVGEGVPYNDLGRVLHHFDPAEYGFRNLPCWAVFDSQYRMKYPVLTVLPGDPDPEWLPRDDTIEGLARKAGINPAGLARTVARWNQMVQKGRDVDFHRGETSFERHSGDPRLPHPNLGAIERPPFYALPIYPGALGTSGGPEINVRGEVLDVRGEVIPGLYAAGNAAGSPTGAAYYSGGGTIGPAMTWGYLCGIHAAQAAKGNGS